MRKIQSSEPNLFDMIEKEEAKEDPKRCTHRREKRSLTVWPGETCERLTMTCEFCGRYRGRFPNE